MLFLNSFAKLFLHSSQVIYDVVFKNIFSNKFETVTLEDKQLLQFYSIFNQGIIDCTRTETFAKEPRLAKLLLELKSMPERFRFVSYRIILFACVATNFST